MGRRSSKRVSQETCHSYVCCTIAFGRKAAQTIYMQRYFSFLLLAGIVCLLSPVRANNLQITAAEVYGSTLSFSIAWENSWNFINSSIAPHNKDAVWLFAKARAAADGEWFHLPLQVISRQSSCSPALDIAVSTDGKGAFISLAQHGSGSVNNCRIELEVAGEADLSSLDIRLFGIEMVYVPEEAFYLGDGASKYSFLKAGSQEPYLLTSETAIEVNEKNGLFNLDDNRPAAHIPADYPKGYGTFYCMKYEISQEQFTDFLNSLSPQQQAIHIAVPITSPAGTFALAPYEQNRNGIAIRYPAIQNRPAVFALDGNKNGVFNEEDDAASRACNFLNWENIAAYLDWAALRPMTELEFEKICRGPADPLAREFAWGSELVTNANTVEEDGTPLESVSETAEIPYGLANHGAGARQNYLQGPLRTGFAATATTNRITAGSAYYGVMEMSGNLWEACVSTNSQGLGFTGTHGDGELDEEGFARQESWPAKEGSGHRGGAWNSLIRNDLSYEFRDLAISDRYYVFLAVSRRNTTGGRGVRTE